MKKIFLLFALLFSYVSAFASSWDTLLWELKPSQVQRGVRVADWEETSRYVRDGMLKYQVIIDTKKQERFAILNEADTALKGKVEIPQYIHSDEDGDLEVRGLGLYAFYLGRVSEVKLPESVEYIGDCAFFRCYGIEKLNIPEKVHTIGNWAFIYCALDSLCFPENLLNLGELTFDGAIDMRKFYRNLTYMYLGKNISDILSIVHRRGKWHAVIRSYLDIVIGMPKLETIEVSPDNDVYYSKDGVLYSRQNHRFCLYPASKKDLIYRMPDDIRTMHNSKDVVTGDYIFSHIEGNDYVQIIKLSEGIDSLMYAISFCGNLKTVILPSNLKYADCAVRHCDALRAVYAQNPIPSETGDAGLDNTFPSSLNSATLYVPKGSVEAYQSHPVWGTTFKEVKEYDTIDYSVSELSNYDELRADVDQVLISGNSVRIISDDHQSMAYIYDMQGRVVASGIGREFTVGSKGVYILRFKNRTKKFVVK